MINNYALKRILYGLLLFAAIGYIFHKHTVLNSTEMEISEIGKQYTIVIEENSVRNYECIKGEQFSLLKMKELLKLSDYMKQNGILLSPGEYKVNQTDSFLDLIKIFKI